MRTLELILWVTQFGLSVFIPPCVLLLLANWLQNKFGWGLWCTAVFGVLGLLIALSTARQNWKFMRKLADQNRKDPPVSFNDHR